MRESDKVVIEHLSTEGYSVLGTLLGTGNIMPKTVSCFQKLTVQWSSQMK